MPPLVQIGENEYNIVTNANGEQQIQETDTSYFSELSVDDFLTISLFINNDSANVLWEFAFLDFAVYPDELIEISADDQSAYIVALVNHPDGSDVGWEIIEGSGGLSETNTQSENNASVIQLSTSTNPGDTYRIRSTLNSIPVPGGSQAVNGQSETAIIKVVAGEPADITIEKSKSIYRSDHTDTVTVTATIRDQFGNLVEDDTAVTWLLDDSTSKFVSTETETINGQASAVLKAPRAPIDQQVIVKAGLVEQLSTMSVERVTGSLSTNAATLNISNTETTDVTANVNAADGTPVYWTTSNGSISETTVVNSGVATNTLSTTGGIKGEVTVIATVGDRLLFWEGNFTNNSPLTAAVTHRVIVAGADQDGVDSITWADGTVRNIGYFAGTPVNVTGPANTELSVGVIGEQLVEAFTFDALVADIIDGQINGNALNVTGATLDTVVKQYGAGSLLLNGSGNGQIAHNAVFDFNNEFSASLWINPTSNTQSTLLSKGSAWSLELLADGKVKASVTTDQGSYEITTLASVNLNEWNYIGIDYSTNGLRVSVNNNAQTSLSAKGSVSNNTDAIVVAQNLTGHIDEFKIAATSQSGLIKFTGINAAGRLQLDGAGQATFNIANTGALAQGQFATRIPISIRATSPIARSDGFSFIKNAYADDVNEAVTYVQVVERDSWFYTYDGVTSFFGADPESGAGIAANVAGGMLIVADIGSIVKNLWRTTGWTDKEPNWVEVSLSGIGLATELAVGLGEFADAPISGVRAVSASLGDTPFTRVLGTRMKDLFAGDITISAAEKVFLESLAKGDEALQQTFNAIVKSDELYEAAIRAADNLGDEFFDVIKQIAGDTGLGVGTQGAEAIVKSLANVSDDVLLGIKSSSIPLADSMAGLAKAGTKVSPELLTKVLGNNNLYTAGYKQGELLRDMGELASVKGFDLLADTLATGNKTGVLKNFPQGLGFRFELESATFLKRAGIEITELSKKIAVTEINDIGAEVVKRTDIDIVVKLTSGATDTMLQVKRSKDALKSLTKVEEWVGKAAKHMGTDDLSRIKYVLPSGVKIPKKIAKYFSDNKIEVITVPHL